MEKFIITKEIIKNARDYLPVGNKEIFAEMIAEKCVVPCVTPKDEAIGKVDLAIPPLYKENYRGKHLLLMAHFISFYLREALDADHPFDESKYDYYAGSHIFNQLEKWKRDEEVKDKVFDILNDFKDFKKFVDNAIFQKLSEKNDTLSRFSAAIQLVSDPEYIKAAVEEMKKHTETLAEHARTEGDS